MRPLVKLAVPLVAVGVIAAGVGAAAAADDRPGGFRTATVTNRNVAQTLDAVGTVEPVRQAAVGFPVAGTVATVDVKAGATVTVGQTLATLDTGELQDAIDQARAALDQANLTLERALAGESVGRAAAAATGGATLVVVPAAVTVDEKLQAAQQAVLAAQKAVDARLLDARAALDSATAICADVGGSAPSPTATSTTTGTDRTDGIEACRTALAAVLAAQHAVQEAQTALNEAAGRLDDLLAARAEAAGTERPTTPTTTPAPSGPTGGSSGGGRTGAGTGGAASTPSSPAGTDRSGGGGAGGSATAAGPSSADLIAYQAAVDADAARLAVAQQALAQATIVSPISGTVVAIGLAPGDAAEAGSSTATVTVVGDGGYEVTAVVAVDDLPDVAVGQQATVVPDGAGDTIRGEVVAIGAPTTTDGATTYPVTIGIDDGLALGNGTTAAVTVVTDAARSALAVPTSAVHTTGTRATVTVLDGGDTRTVTVGVGAVGSAWTEVTSGLRSGQEVVLADLGEPLPTSATSTNASAAGGRFGPERVGGRFGAPG